MCLLVAKPAFAPIDKLIEECAEITRSNPHGFGVAYVRDGKVIVERGFHKTKSQRKLLRRIKDYPALIHWRYATGGRIDTRNCHPFQLNDGSAFAHNGVFFDPLVAPTSRKSDTAKLAEISPSADALIANLKKIDVRGNKVALIRPSGDTQIFNEQCGQWFDGVWFSNQNYKTPLFKTGIDKTSCLSTSCLSTSKASLKNDPYYSCEFPDLSQEKPITLPSDCDWAVAELVEKYGMRAVEESLENYYFWR